MKRHWLVCLGVVVSFAFSANVQKKVIYHKTFHIECYVTLKKINAFHALKTYYWYKAGEIHRSLSSAGGQLLHGSYAKYYRSNQMEEQGTFNYGLKNGDWKTWYENGGLKQLEQWKDGFRDGAFVGFDSNGKVAVKGFYKNNLKTGYWINYKTKDTTYHKDNLVYDDKPKSKVGKIIEKIFKKRDSIEKAQAKHERLIKRQNDSVKRAKAKQERQAKRRNDSLQRARKKQDKKIAE